MEIEPEWAFQNPHTLIGDAAHLSFSDSSFDAVATSPTYGNRIADHYKPRDKSRRVTYRTSLGRDLHPQNSGRLQWGRKYRDFHLIVWKEATRVLRPGGRFVLNISDHYRNHRLQAVTAWHIGTLIDLGLSYQERAKIPTPRMRHGENYQLRAPFESVCLLVKP